MSLDDFVAIDVHTHAWKSALRVGDAPTESRQAMGNYFRYVPQHQTVPEMADMYRKLKIAFVVFTVDGEKGASRGITNEAVAELAHQHGDVAIPFASINPHRGAEGVAQAKRLIKDYPVIAPEKWLAEFDKLPIKPGVRPLILKQNAARLLGL